MRPVRWSVVLLLVTLAACSPTRLDENLCPVGQTPPRTTLLLLDTSDPLAPKHREVFARLIREMQEPAGPDDYRVGPGEALVVYELSGDLERIEPLVQVCNPGDRPDDWDFKREVTQGKMIALRQWQRFRERVEPLFADEEATPQARSLILECLAVIVPRHVPSSRMRGGVRTHLVIYSDLLQHSDSLSHYGPFPQADAIKKTAPLRHLQTDLDNVEVSLYRLERKRDARWQSTDHYYWWTRLIQSFGGQVIHQESI